MKLLSFDFELGNLCGVCAIRMERRRVKGQSDGSASFKIKNKIFNPSQQSDLHPLKKERRKTTKSHNYKISKVSRTQHIKRANVFSLNLKSPQKTQTYTPSPHTRTKKKCLKQMCIKWGFFC